MIKCKLTAWQDEARTYYEEMFLTHNDAGHDMEHVDEVWRNALTIISKSDNREQYDLDVMFLAVYCHDLFATTDRKIHHVLAANYVINRTDIFLDRFSNGVLRDIGHAVLEHRASGKLTPSNKYSRVLKSADKGIPNLDRTIERIILSNMGTAITNDELTQHVYDHLIEKFGRDGYLYDDKEYAETYREELTTLWGQIDAITTAVIAKRVNAKRTMRLIARDVHFYD